MLAIAGAHCTGKTTLARALSGEAAIKFVASSLSPIFDKLGLPANQVLEFKDRMVVQEAMLEHCLALWRDETNFVTDRSPVDLMAYTMLDMPRMLTPDELNWWRSYRSRCMEAMLHHFFGVLFLRPGVSLVNRDKHTASMCPAFIELTDTVMSGLLADPALRSIPRHSVRTTDFRRRILSGLNLIDVIFDKCDQDIGDSLVH